MKVVKIEVTPLGQGDVASGHIAIQQLRGDGWVQLQERPWMSDQGPIVLQVNDDQRLVISGGVSHKVMIDKVQNVAQKVELPPRKNVPLASPGSAADDESPPGDVVNRAMANIEEDALRERRAAAETAARQKLAQAAKPAVGTVPEMPREKIPLVPGIVDDDPEAQKDVVGSNKVGQIFEQPKEQVVQPHHESINPNLPSWAKPK